MGVFRTAVKKNCWGLGRCWSVSNFVLNRIRRTVYAQSWFSHVAPWSSILGQVWVWHARTGTAGWPHKLMLTVKRAASKNTPPKASKTGSRAFLSYRRFLNSRSYWKFLAPEQWAGSSSALRFTRRLRGANILSWVSPELFLGRLLRCAECFGSALL